MNIYETIVKRKFTIEDILIFVLITIMIVGAAIFSSVFTPIQDYWLIITAVACGIGVFLVSRRFIEFEYSIIDSEITIEKIINQRKRKRLLQIPIKEFEMFGHAGKAGEACGDIKLFDSYGASLAEENLYFFVATFNGKRKVIFFQPTDKMIDEITRIIPHKIVK